VVHVLDASRSVGVAGALVGKDASRPEAYAAGIKAEYAALRARHESGEGERGIPLAAARANRPAIDWPKIVPPKPSFLGVRAFDDWPLESLVPYIDWTPFFHAWELHGAYPRILNDEKVGEAARSLFRDGQAMLKRIVDEKLLTAKAVIGFWPANAIGDDIELYADETRAEVRAVVHTLRQQGRKTAGRPHLALADYVAPKDTGIADYFGAFAVSAGFGETELSAEFEALHDDYSAIMAKGLADRLAEAFAEALHERVRKELWGYAPDEAFDNTQLIKESYQGIRPAPGYPACPDHTEKGTLFDLLDAPKVGITLTQSFAMSPPSSVAGWYLWHPETRYFGVGKIGRDQVEDYARRKGLPPADIERWLAPNLGYQR
jgi:5-methyltetrahydrofolate--homocysteine methyltransferase